MFTDDDIAKIAALESQHAAEKATLACRQANERAAMAERHQAEQKAVKLGGRPTNGAPLQLGSTALEGGGSTGLEQGGGDRAASR